MNAYLSGANRYLSVEDDESWEIVKQRIYLATKCSNYRCLSDFLNKGKLDAKGEEIEAEVVDISHAKRCRHIPVEWLAVIFMQTGVAPHWIMTGQGAMNSKLSGAFDSRRAQR